MKRCSALFISTLCVWALGGLAGSLTAAGPLAGGTTLSSLTSPAADEPTLPKDPFKPTITLPPVVAPSRAAATQVYTARTSTLPGTASTRTQAPKVQRPAVSKGRLYAAAQPPSPAVEPSLDDASPSENVPPSSMETEDSNAITGDITKDKPEAEEFAKPAATLKAMREPLPASASKQPAETLHPPAVVTYQPAAAPHHPVVPAPCDAGCDSCCGRCVAGAGFHFVQPYWEDNPAFAVQFTESGFTSTRQEDFDYDYVASPYFWLGYETCEGDGYRARWWNFDQSAGNHFTNPGDVTIIRAFPLGLGEPLVNEEGDLLAFETHLRLDALDLECFHNCQCGCWWLQLSGGGRYVHLSQSYNVLRVNEEETEVNAVSSGHHFRGFGPTAAVEVRRPLKCCGWSLYGSARGSLLFGTGRQQAIVAEISITPTEVDTGDTDTASTSRDDIMPVLELELGGEWTKQIRCCQLFVRAGVVAQGWFGAGNGANSEQLTTAEPPNQNTDDDDNLGFFGLSVSAGVNY